jgi:hypothetical protein
MQIFSVKTTFNWCFVASVYNPRDYCVTSLWFLLEAFYFGNFSTFVTRWCTFETDGINFLELSENLASRFLLRYNMICNSDSNRFTVINALMSSGNYMHQLL